MLAFDEEAFICDIAETYGIYDYHSVPCRLLGTLASGLREDSRIRMKISGVKAGDDTRLLANIQDLCSMLLWMQTEDAQKGRNRPKSMAYRYYEQKQVDHSHDLTPAQYNEIRNRILKNG